MSSSKKMHTLISFWVLLLAAIVFPSSAMAGLVNGSAWHIAGVADFNGDAALDILWTNQATGDVALWYMNGGNVIAEEKLENTPGGTWCIAGVGDFNRDGSPDLVWRDSATGQIEIQYMNGSTVIGLEAVAEVSSPWNIVGVADFSQDDRPDILLRHSVTGEAVVWFIRGTTVTNTAAIASLPPPWNIVWVGDFNADGSPDILWRNSVTGEAVEWLMSGTAVRDIPIIAALALSSSDEYINGSDGDLGSGVVSLSIETLPAVVSPIYSCFCSRPGLFNISVRAPPNLSV